MKTTTTTIEQYVDRLAKARDNIVRMRERLREVKEERDAARAELAEVRRELEAYRMIMGAREDVLMSLLSDRSGLTVSL